MRTLIAVLVLAAVAPPAMSPAFAAASAESKAAIQKCVASVRMEAPINSDFDAYAIDKDAPDQFAIHSYGTKKARFDFDKCMNESGTAVLN